MHRKRIQTTSSYIYDRLFLNGVKSDVTILALGEKGGGREEGGGRKGGEGERRDRGREEE